MQVLAIEHYRRLEARGIRLQFNSGRRNRQQQQTLVAKTEAADSSAALSRAGVSGFAAKRSLHEFGLAYDGEPSPKNDHTWQIFGDEAEALGLVWGGRWRRTLENGDVVTDRPHVQIARNTDTLRELAGAGVFGALTIAAAAVVRVELEKRLNVT